MKVKILGKYIGKTGIESILVATESKDEVNQLATPEGIRNAARAQLGYVFPGEQRMSLVQVDELPTTLPSSWPYTLITNIVTIRTAEAATSNKALAPLAP
jgi:hypothetical protein